MTPAQQMRVLGFNASLSQRGVSLTFADVTFNALVEKVEPDRSEFSLSNETRDFSKVHILRTALKVTEVEVGSVLRDAEAKIIHRVTRIEDHPTNIALIFHCETTAE